MPMTRARRSLLGIVWLDEEMVDPGASEVWSDGR